MVSSPVILITGASSGIGEATARLFGKQGYRVVLAARRLDRLQSIAEEIRAGGRQALPVEADLNRFEDIQRLVGCALDEFGQVDVLFNNAGFGRLDWLETLDPQKDIREQLEVNLLAAIWMTKALLPHMIARRSGYIINMSSMAGWVATPTYTVYAASKFGMRGFTDALRREVGVFGIHVSALYPGGVTTEFGEKAGIKRKTGYTTPKWLRLTPENVAQAVFDLTRKPRRAVILPWPMRFMIWLDNLAPGFLDRLIEKNFVKPERGLS